MTRTAMILALVSATAINQAGCTQDAGKPSGRMERAQSVKASSERGPESFCDRYAPGDSAPPLSLPPLNNVSSGKIERLAAGERWKWINIWATFCLPCLHEMDTLVAWREQFSGNQTPFDLAFISVDEGVAEVKAYLAKHPKIAALPSYHTESSAALESAVKALGAGSLDSIPIHMLVAPDGKVRCVRTGALNSDDLPVIRRIIQAR